MSSAKIVALKNIGEIVEGLKKSGKKIVQCHGVFDLLHPGHIRHFELAKKHGDVLVVSITKDQYVNKGPGHPAFNEHLRAESLAALAAIDYVVISQMPTAVEAIRTIKPTFYVKGNDYANREKDITRGILAEEEAVKAVGGEIAFTNDITFSSSQLLNSYFTMYPEKARNFLAEFKSKFSAGDVISHFESTQNLKVLLLGDAIIDEYHYCQPMGKSPKETIISTKYLNEESFPGGIVACANHIANFSNNVTMLTVLGQQASRRLTIEQSLNSKIKSHFFYREDAPTTVKRRYVEPAFLTKMFSVAMINDTDLPEPVETEICNFLTQELDKYDLVFIADYGHGMMTKKIRQVVMDKAKYLAVNVQSNSANHGYNLVTKYPKADYISIDEPELRLAMGRKYEPYQQVVLEFAERYSPKTIVTITRGHNGSITCKNRSELFEAPCLSTKVVDRVGAGDAYFAVTAMLAAKGAPIEIMGLAGNIAGAMAVEIVCNRSSIESVPFAKFVKSALA